MSAVIYARVSPRPEPGHASIALQVEECERWGRENNVEVDSVHTDQGFSGADPDRPGLWEAVDELGKGNVLVVHKLDRLARDVYLSEGIHREIEKCRARVHAVHGGAVENTPEGKMVRQILDAAAEYERRVIKARTSAAMQRHQREGKRMSNQPPFGMMLDPEDPAMLIACPHEQAAISLVHNMRVAGKGYKTIANNLNQSGIPARGRQWYASSVRAILSHQHVPA